ncbi:MAG: HD domain-containing protein [Ignavibacteria bacterium]|nr:HD domain-containing protein [Ignavibacteria bacterium]
MPDRSPDPAALLKAVHFAAEKHREQRRKDRAASPYINHPIEVAHLLATLAGVTDSDTLIAAILHDTIEDTETTAEELEQEFGGRVRSLVEEMTDDKTLPKELRKQLQVENAPGISEAAKCIRLADKICNVRDVTDAPPEHWSIERRRGYLDWTEEVVSGCRGVHETLERHYDDVLRRGRFILNECT